MGLIRIIRKFNRLFTKSQMKRVLLLFVIMLIAAFLEVLGVSLMVPLMTAIMSEDILETNAVMRTVAEFLHISTHRNFVLICIAGLIGVYVVKDLFLIFQVYVQNRFIYNNRFHIQCRILRAYMQKSYEFFLQASSGEIMRVINNDVNGTFALLGTMLGFLSEALVMVALIAAVFVVNPLITCIVMITMGGCLILIGVIIRPRMKYAGEVFRQEAAVSNQWILQAINGIKDVKIARKEEFFQRNYEVSGRRMVQAQKRQAVWQSTPRLMIELVSVVSVLVVMAVMILLGRDIQSLIPALSAFAIAALRLLPAANRITNAMNDIAFFEPSLDTLIADIEQLQKAEAENVPILQLNKKEGVTVHREIVIKDLTYSYPGMESPVLEHTGMVIPAGASVGVVGVSGAGKTTLADLLLGLLTPQSGEILADGINVMEQYQDWLDQIGYIPQTIFMLDGSIRENVAFGCEMENKEQLDIFVWQALKEAQLDQFVRELPHGLDTQIGERGVRVSGGQRQRIGIARALFNDPAVIIFDEATSALDNETEKTIMESIDALHGKRTVLIIAHRLTTIEGCDIVYRVEDGQIVRES